MSRKGWHSLAKWQVLFTDDTRARHYQRSVVATCGVSSFDKLLELVSDVIQSAPDGTELAPIFAFGESISAALRSHQDCAEKPFENFFSEVCSAYRRAMSSDDLTRQH